MLEEKTLTLMNEGVLGELLPKVGLVKLTHLKRRMVELNSW